METQENKTWVQKHQTAIFVVGLIVLAGLLLLPDYMIRKYIPWK